MGIDFFAIQWQNLQLPVQLGYWLEAIDHYDKMNTSEWLIE